jgi:hypothetical protein
LPNMRPTFARRGRVMSFGTTTAPRFRPGRPGRGRRR